MPSPIHNNVMRRVYIIYMLGFIFNTTALAVVVVVVSGGAVMHVVHIGSVWSNLIHVENGAVAGRFLVSAFEHTKLITQTAVIALISATGYFVYSTVSTFRSMSFARAV